MVDVIILNGGSSSKKTSIVKCLQNLLPTSWLRFSIDDTPDAMLKADGGIKFGEVESISPGTEFRRL
ncbi:hypothetical protein OF830_26535 [Bacillus paramycoides]|nr:hypothetical protein [Bacillus paramycoides]MCW9134346.1 hypothetical protein [Bacillus paramycoides]